MRPRLQMTAEEMGEAHISGQKQKQQQQQKHEHACVRGLWMTCAHWLAFLIHLVVAFIQQNTPTIARLLAFFGFKSLLPPSSASPSFRSFISLERQHQQPEEQEQQQEYRDLLPPRTADEDVNKLTVVLDLDETLVCAYESSGLPHFLHAQSTQPGIESFELQCISADKDGEGKYKINHVTVYERPGLQEFLTRTSEFAELVLFTAGLEGYARPLVDKIDPERRISARLYRPATVNTKYREHVKDLSHLARDLHRTVIIDNNPFSFLLQPLNGIPCVSFTGAHSDDDQLLQVLLPLLKHLATQEDVRPVLYERFHMPAWFQKRGIPASDWPV